MMKYSLSLFSLILYTVFCLVYQTHASFTIHDGSFKPDYVLRATAQNITINCESRYSVIISGSSPGPTLYFLEGKTTWVRVYNDIADQNLTVHWHGLAQRTAPFSDGTPQASQWPIPPANFFDYEVRPEAGDAGTYFYHSHVGFQAISAHGALIVEQCSQPPYHYDEDIVLMLGDYYNKTDAQVSTELLASPFVWAGETLALLLNGQSGTSGFNNATDASCAPLNIEVEPDKDYRIRFIGGTAISLVTLGIEDHSNLTIIEADGGDTKPFTSDHLQVAPGQRFSLLFRTKSAEELAAYNKTSFWIRFENRERPANVSGYALLSYSTKSASLPQSLPVSPPVTLPLVVYDWLEYSLEPYNSSEDVFPPKSTRTVTIETHQVGSYINKTFETTLEWAQNGNVWQVSRVQKPYLVSIYENGQSAIPNYEAALANSGWDPTTKVFPAKVGEVLDIIW
jgi:L-ascorbate oxidase